MSFLHNCFIENSAEARRWLERIGYEPYSLSGYELLFTQICSPALYSNKAWYSDCGWISPGLKNHIDCRENVSLFKAVTAIRDDNDIYQYFTDGEKWDRSDIHDFFQIREYHKKEGLDRDKLHKASLDELINHFKK